MKNFLLIPLLFGLVLGILGCKKEQTLEDILATEDLELIKSKKDELNQQLNGLNSQIRQLDEALVRLDPDLNYELVKSMTISDTIFEHYFSIQSAIESQQDVNVTPEYSGVMRLNVSEGAYVGKGAVLATIDDGGLNEQIGQAQIGVSQAQSQVQNAEIQRDLAKTTFLKQKSLWKKKIGSEIQFLQAKTSYESAEKQVTIARQQLSASRKGVSQLQEQLAKTRVTAPFSGVVEDIITESGQAVGPGVPILRLVNTSSLKAVADVPEVYLPYVKRGTKAIINLPSIGQLIDGSVGRVGSAINPDNRTFKVEIPIQNSDGLVKPNLNAEIRINDYTNSSVVVIPESIIRKDGDGDFVFVKQQAGKKQVAKKVYITTGKSNNGKVEILNGLKSGDQIIIQAPAKLSNGDEVQEIKP